jgi:molybdopterin synthase sulfur carrier subunit
MMARLVLFGPARVAADTSGDEVPGTTVGDVLDAASARYGAAFATVLPTCVLWVNGEPASREQRLVAGDELGVLPPFSGG